MKMFCFSVFFIILKGVAYAACTATQVITALTLSPSIIEIPKSITPGTAIGPVYGPFENDQMASFRGCATSRTQFLNINGALKRTPFNGVYSTEVIGIGVRIWSVGPGPSVDIQSNPVVWYVSDKNETTKRISSIYIQFYVTDTFRIRQATSILLPSPLVTAISSTSQTLVVNGLEYANLIVANPVLFVPVTYTCTVDNPILTVTLPPVSNANLIRNGSGVYPEGRPFDIKLTCDSETTVTIKFDGNTIPGKNDVLANTSSGNNNLGIQMLLDSNPIVLGEPLKIIDSAKEQETLSLNAHYYYNGGGISSGEVAAVATYTLSYD